MRLILHVGPHKTATTWLQANFHANRQALKAHGIYYPVTGERVRTAHHDIADRPKELSPESEWMARELAVISAEACSHGCDILLSGEGFSRWPVKSIKALAAALGADQTVIVYVLRDPASTIASFWSQRVKSGSALPLPDFVSKMRKQFFAPNAVLKRLTGLRQAASGHLVLLAYDEIRRRGEDIHDVFMREVFAIEGLPLHADAAANLREPLELTEFMRLVNRRVTRCKGSDVPNIGRAMRHLVTAGERQAAIDAVAGVPAARQTLRMPRKRTGHARLEGRIIAAFGPLIRPQPTGPLFLRGPEILNHYDAGLLEQDRLVCAVLDRVGSALAPNSLRMRFGAFLQTCLRRRRQICKRLGLRK
jgi:hypothetical protein